MDTTQDATLETELDTTQATDAKEALRQRVWRSLPPVMAALTALYVIFTISHAILLPTAVKTQMVIMAGVTAMVLFSIMLGVRRWSQLERWTYPVAFFAMLLISANSAVHVYLTQDIVQTTNVMLVILGAGFFMLSGAWYALTISVALGSWGLAVAGLGEQVLFVHFVFALLSTTVASVVLRFVHVRDLVENHRLRMNSERQRNEMAHLATHDMLTGLANRRKFLEYLALEIAHARRSGRKLGVLYLDLDDFKQFNDAWGHEFGDEVLRLCGQILSGLIRETDLACRYGGDEFAVLLTGLRDASDVDIVIAKILHRFEQAESINGIRTRISLSIGKAVLPDETDDIDELLRIADLSMYAHKGSSKHPGVAAESA